MGQREAGQLAHVRHDQVVRYLASYYLASGGFNFQGVFPVCSAAPRLVPNTPAEGVHAHLCLNPSECGCATWHPELT